MNKAILVIAILLTPFTSFAHSGRTDSSGGHNCRTGSCAGTYHYHNKPAPVYYPPVEKPKSVKDPITSPYVSTKQSTRVVQSSETNDDGTIWGWLALIGGGGYWLGRRNKKY